MFVSLMGPCNDLEGCDEYLITGVLGLPIPVTSIASTLMDLNEALKPYDKLMRACFTYKGERLLFMLDSRIELEIAIPTLYCALRNAFRVFGERLEFYVDPKTRKVIKPSGRIQVLGPDDICYPPGHPSYMYTDPVGIQA
jgi:hypothetical protein